LLEIHNLKDHSLPRWTKTGLVILLSLSPALLLARLISRYGVDIPYADEWQWGPFLFKAHEHSLTVADFFAQHNEHRYIFPKLILLILTPLTSGNTKGLMFFSLAIVGLSSGALWYLLSRTVPISLNKRALLWGVLNLVLFSPVQAENWMWGYQFALFFTNLLFVAGVAVAVSRLSLSAKFFLCFAIAVAATFSFGGGVVLWPLTFPLALAGEMTLGKRAKFFWFVGWLCAAGAAVGLYFFHYVKPTAHPPLAASYNPLDYFLYITTFLGGHLSKADQTESILVAAENGTVSLLLYLGGLFWTIRSRDADLKQKMLPWLGLGAFAVLNAALAAITRIGFGINQALDSRYTTFSLFISLSLIGMYAVIATCRFHREVSRPSFSRKWLVTAWLITAYPTLLLIAHLNASWWGYGSIQQSRLNRLHGKAALLFANVLENAGTVHSRYLLGNAEWANVANSLGFIHPPLIQSPELSKFSSRPQQAGFFESIIVRQGGACEASGWAMIPKGLRPADAVLLTYDDSVRGPIAFAVAAPIKSRPEVVDALHDARYEYSGWLCKFQRSSVPAGDQLITAWSFDLEKMVIYPLIAPQTLR
jgi:hypothetical protein